MQNFNESKEFQRKSSQASPKDFWDKNEKCEFSKDKYDQWIVVDMKRSSEENIKIKTKTKIWFIERKNCLPTLGANLIRTGYAMLHDARSWHCF